jgi:hypothetical protein
VTRFSGRGEGVRHCLEYVILGEPIQEYKNTLNSEISYLQGSVARKELKKETRKRNREAKRFYKFPTTMYFHKRYELNDLSWKGEERLAQTLNADSWLNSALATLKDKNPKLEEMVIGYVPMYGYVSINVTRFLPSREDLEMFNRIAQHIKKVWLTKN